MWKYLLTSPLFCANSEAFNYLFPPKGNEDIIRVLTAQCI